MENVNFIFKFSPSYVKNLLEIVVKLKIKKCWPAMVLKMLNGFFFTKINYKLLSL